MLNPFGSKKAQRRCAGPFSSPLCLWHDFLSGKLAVPHALDACDPVVVGDVDGPNALGVAA